MSRAARWPKVLCAMGLSLSIGVPGALAGGPLVVTADGSPASWDAGAPVPFHTDQGSLGTLGETGAVAFATACFARWQDVPTSSVGFVRLGSLSVNVNAANFGPYLGPFGGAGAPLGTNAIVFDADGAIFDSLYGVGTGVLGFASPTWFSDGSAPVPIGAEVPTGARIVEGLMFLNGKWIDGIDNPGAGNREMPLARFEAVIVHEAGHFAGLDHTQIHGLSFPAESDLPGTTTPYETMLPFNRDETQATLERDDVVAISSLYPAPGFASSTGRIEGRVRARDGTPLAGINVIARNVADDHDAVSGVTSAHAASLGAYRLEGLSAGASYRVEAQEIDVFHTGGSRVGPFPVPVTLPGPPEFFSGPSESADPALDDPAQAFPLIAQAGIAITGADIRLNAQPFGVSNVVSGETRGPREFAVADFDRDGVPDFAATQLGFAPGNLIRFHRGLGRGRFAAPVTVAEFPGNEDIVTGQFNTAADSYPDIAVASRSLNQVRVYHGDGAGGFSSPTIVMDAADTDFFVDLLTGDLDLDGSADLLALVRHAAGGATVHALRGTPGGGFVPVLTSLSASSPIALATLALGQFTGSPAPDVVGVSSAGPGVSGSPAALAMLAGSGSGTFTASSIGVSAITERLDPLGVAAGDFNEDGKVDLVLSDLDPVGGPPNYTRSFLDILVRSGSGFALSSRHDVAETFQPALAVADLDGDGHLDIASTGSTFAPGTPGAKVHLAYGSGVGGILSRSSVWGLAEFPQAIAAADLDGNGSMDLLVSDSASGPQGLSPTASYSVLLQLPACAVTADCDDGDFCNGAESCDTTVGECLPGSAPSCDDADPCTADSCGEPLVLLSASFENSVSDWVSAPRGGADTWHQDRYTCFGQPFPSTMLSSNGNAGPGCVAGSSTERSQLLGPPVSLPGSGAASLTFDALSYDEAGSCLAAGDRDAHEVGITTDGGASWTVLNACFPLADGTGAIHAHTFDLGAFLGRTIQVMFLYDTRDQATGHTFAVDNARITATPSGCGHTPVVPDADHDFHLDAACGGDDCDDGEPLVWGDPMDVTNMTVAGTGPTDLAWDSQESLSGPGTGYDLVSGSLSPGPPWSDPSTACMQSGSQTGWSDPRPAPPPGQGVWYLARARNVCGLGTFGSAGADQGITACP